MEFQRIMEPLVTIAGLIVTVAIIAVLVSKKANTAGVLQAGGSAFSNALGVAESPVTGASYQINLSYPNDSSLSASSYAPPTGGFGA